jgi:hypothetical protein
MLWNADNFDNTNNVRIIIGKSVITGARATLMPDRISCRSVSEIKSVRSGPGENPADNPSTVPTVKKYNIVISFESNTP